MTCLELDLDRSGCALDTLGHALFARCHFGRLLFTWSKTRMLPILRDEKFVATIVLVCILLNLNVVVMNCLLNVI